MPPDFTKNTIDTLAKRAAYLCSNPDCRVSTVGPNSEAAEAIVIGEAAHIYSARGEETRYDSQMTDQARSEISNAIWLCRNCHRQIDRDPQKFPADLLFLWRERHEEYVASNLGSQSDKARFEIAKHAIAQFDGYPPRVRRIAYDKPPGWEWSLTGALMRDLNAPLFRRLADLRDGVCALQIRHLNDDEVMSWLSDRIQEMYEMIGPLGRIVRRFNVAWGEPGQPGDIDEIHHTALLLRESLAQVVLHEEQLKSIRVAPKFDEVVKLIQDALGSEVGKFKRLPDRLDEIVEMATQPKKPEDLDGPIIVQEVIEFTLPDGWSDNVDRALKKLRGQSGGNAPVSRAPSYGCVAWLLLCVSLIVLASVY